MSEKLKTLFENFKSHGLVIDEQRGVASLKLYSHMSFAGADAAQGIKETLTLDEKLKTLLPCYVAPKATLAISKLPSFVGDKRGEIDAY